MRQETGRKEAELRELVKGGICTVCAVLFGCTQSTGGEQAIAEAQLALIDARAGGARVYAASDLEAAERQLHAAQSARDSGDQTKARRFGEQAVVRARLAAARADFERTRTGAARRDNET